jgi:hypothetical protein
MSDFRLFTSLSDKTAIETAKTISDMQWDRISKVFDLMVLATVRGYLIGKKATHE